MEWFEGIPPDEERVTLKNKVVFSHTEGAYTYELRGRAGRWFVVRYLTELGIDNNARRSKFFTSMAKAMEAFDEAIA